MIDLNISEIFYSIQGEGLSSGIPSVFIRLSGCNLSCQNFSAIDESTGEHLGCDSKLLWKSCVSKSIKCIINFFEKNGFLNHLKNGSHLVITGGEPLLQQLVLIDFLNNLDNKIGMKCFVEIETNSTILFDEKLLSRINQINASPKLSNCGEVKSKRYIQKVLQQLSSNSNAIFKFVIQNPTDIDEVINDFAKPFHINHSRIWLMPEGISADVLRERSRWIVDLCKIYYMNYTPRLQIMIWGNEPGR